MRTYEDIHLMMLRNDVQGLISAASDADETIREEAVKVLRAMNPPEAKEVLKQALNDPSPKVRRVALGAVREVMVDKVISGVDVVKEKQSSSRWVWIMLGSWGVSFLLLALLILIWMFTDGNFGHSGQIIGVLFFGGSGIVMLWVAVKKLKVKSEQKNQE